MDILHPWGYTVVNSPGVALAAVRGLLRGSRVPYEAGGAALGLTVVPGQHAKMGHGRSRTCRPPRKRPPTLSGAVTFVSRASSAS